MSTTPSELLTGRQQWLLEDGSVHVVENPRGGFDVVLRLDGTYTDRAAATAAVTNLQRAVWSATRKAIHATQQVAQAQQRADDL